MEKPVSILVAELGYPWYREMLADDGVRTVQDVLVKVGVRRADDAADASSSPGATADADESADAAAGRADPPHLAHRGSVESLASVESLPPISREDATVMVTAYLVSLGFSETHADEIAHEMVRAHLKADAAVRRAVSSDQMFAFDTLDDMAEFAEAFEGEEERRAGPTDADRAAVRALAAAAKANADARASTEHRRVTLFDDRAVVSTESRAVPDPSAVGSIPAAGERATGATRSRSSYAATQDAIRARSAGGFYDASFLRAVAPLYDLHMGAENLGPMLYSLVRFNKPARVLEVGAGYTSVFILQALRDNAAELEAYRELRAARMCACGDAPWSVDAFFDGSGDGGGRYRGDPDDAEGPERNGARGADPRRATNDAFASPSGFSALASPDTLTSPSDASLLRVTDTRAVPGTEDARVASGVLHCIDNMAHEHTTAHAVKGVAESLGMADRLRVHEADAFDPDLPSTLAPGTEFDLLWIDLGAAHRIEGFFEAWWPRVRPEGGMVIVHSTLTNALSRGWLERMRDVARAEPAPPFGAFECMSLLEPHKMFQNSVTMFQKRGGAFGAPYHEPVHTKFP
jgi:predicted O-methyltransferase YrrM